MESIQTQIPHAPPKKTISKMVNSFNTVSAI